LRGAGKEFFACAKLKRDEETKRVDNFRKDTSISSGAWGEGWVRHEMGPHPYQGKGSFGRGEGKMNCTPKKKLVEEVGPAGSS